MKKILLISISIFCVCITTIFAEVEDAYYAIALDTNIRVRDFPNLSSHQIDYVFEKENIIILGRTSEKMKIDTMESYWFFIEKEYGLKGWVYGHFFEIIDQNKVDEIKILDEDQFIKSNPSHIDLSFILNNKRLYIGQQLEAVKNILGAPRIERIDKKNETTEGKWDTIFYEYDGFSIRGMREWPDIYSLYVKNNEIIKSSKNIRIGSSREEIQKAYGINYSRENLELISYSVKDQIAGYDDVLWFSIEKDQVTKFGFNIGFD